MKQWIKCNILNKHNWFNFGDTDLYGNLWWRCGCCQRVKYHTYDQKLVDKKREELRNLSPNKKLGG
jgi:hypothetical protein